MEKLEFREHILTSDGISTRPPQTYSKTNSKLTNFRATMNLFKLLKRAKQKFLMELMYEVLRRSNRESHEDFKEGL